MADWHRVAASIRDPDSWVETDGTVFRRHFRAESSWRDVAAAEAAGLFASLGADGLIPDHELVAGHDGPGELHTAAIAPVSLPSEWTFGMLRDAALLTLEVSRRALEAGFELKDASAFNVVFDGTEPRFVDLGSIRSGYSGHWPAFSQFHDHFANPLVALSEGLPVTGLRWPSTGVPLDVVAPLAPRTGAGRSLVRSRLWAEKVSSRLGDDARRRVATTEVPLPKTLALLDKTRQRIERIPEPPEGLWASYERRLPYDAEAVDRKERLVGEFAEAVGAVDTALDVGCNTGRFSRIASATAGRVVAIDTDASAVDELYRSAPAGISPMVVDIAQPTPPTGWAGREHAGWLDRMPTFDLSLWLAVIHHLALSQGIRFEPLAAFVAERSTTAIIEWVAPDDPQVAAIRARDLPDWYTRDGLVGALEGAGFSIMRTEPVSGTRELWLLTR
ncbi:MAG: class I SAM-dependent methyltransferase [Acidimicrobiia bacterium]